jgi:hypothetical protein
VPPARVNAECTVTKNAEKGQSVYFNNLRRLMAKRLRQIKLQVLKSREREARLVPGMASKDVKGYFVI